MENLPEKLLNDATMPLAPDCSYNEWLGGLCFAIAGWKYSSWRIADALNHPHAETPEGQQAIEDVIKLAGLDDRADATFRNIKSVGRKFPPEVRNLGPFTYYQEAQALPVPKALEVIQSAESAKDIREAVRAVKGGSAGTRSAATVMSDDDLNDICLRLRRYWADAEPILKDEDMGLNAIKMALKPLYQALKDLLR